jgi:hypothetical protein
MPDPCLTAWMLALGLVLLGLARLLAAMWNIWNTPAWRLVPLPGDGERWEKTLKEES